MDVRNNLKGMWGTDVNVNGTTYHIDDDGIARGLKDVDAAKLISFSSGVWKSSDGKPIPKPVPTEAPDPVEIEEDTEPEEAQEAEKESPEEGSPEEESEGEENEWPDPTEDMEIDYLREMADAYAIKNAGRMNKATLVKRIRAEMYGDE